MTVLGIILARAGSKGLPDKCLRKLLGRPVIAYTFDHATAARRLTGVVFSTDSEPAKTFARDAGIEVIDRPAKLASDTATVDDAARHAVEAWEQRHQGTVDAVVLLYGNVPLRTADLIDRAIERLESERCRLGAERRTDLEAPPGLDSPPRRRSDAPVSPEQHLPAARSRTAFLS